MCIHWLQDAARMPMRCSQEAGQLGQSPAASQVQPGSKAAMVELVPLQNAAAMGETMLAAGMQAKMLTRGIQQARLSMLLWSSLVH